MRWVRAVGAMVALLAVVLGAPVLLLGWGRLGGDGWWRVGDGSLLLTVLTLAGWVAWLGFVLAIGAEIVRYASGNRYKPDLPLLGGLQALSAALVLAVVGVAGWPTAVAPTADAERPPPQQPTESAAPSDSHPVETPRQPRAAPSQAVAHPLADHSPTPSTEPENSAPGYAVATGDDLWSVAEHLLGDGRRWRELARLNPELLSDPMAQLTAGTSLRIPADEQPATITVERGDTLSGLALEHLGKAGRWPRIADANADLIADPDHIEVGWELTIPVLEPTASTTVATSPQPADRGSTQPEQPSWDDPAPAPPAPSAPTEPTATAAPDSVEPSAAVMPDSTEPTPTPAASPPPEAASASADEGSPDVLLLGGLGAMAAAGLAGGWQARRLLQSRVRPPGRRVLHPADDLARIQAAVGRRQEPDRARILDLVLRLVGQYCHRTAQLRPELAQVTLADDRLLLQWAGPAGAPPEGFDGDQAVWQVPYLRAAGWPRSDHPCAFPALVSLGTDPDGATIMIDLERSGVLGVTADTHELQRASLAAMAVELACAPWAAELRLTAVGGEGSLARAAGGEAVTWMPDTETALTRLRACRAERARELAGLDLRRFRVDPERAEAVAPQVFVFHDPVTDEQRDELDALLTAPSLGIAAVLLAAAETEAQWELFGDPLRPSGRLSGAPDLVAHAIPESTRDAVASLCRIADSTATEPAPWWSHDRLPDPEQISEDAVDIVSLRRAVRVDPTVMLIGPVDLSGAAGPEPARSRAQLIEMATWLLEHPGQTATQMAAGLGMAESTRRSNLSRLRSWLGADAQGEPYLPDAYSGRIRLHPQVTSDVQQLRLLTGPGVNRIGSEGLVAALDLVRGGLLADAVPGQWYWAEELRSDVAATLRDAALVLIDRSLRRGELDVARWAADRALAVAPDDELLVCARIRTEHAAGNRPGVERHVLRLTQQARLLGVDLMPETVMLCQQVMEGRPRARSLTARGSGA